LGSSSSGITDRLVAWDSQAANIHSTTPGFSPHFPSSGGGAHSECSMSISEDTSTKKKIFDRGAVIFSTAGLKPLFDLDYLLFDYRVTITLNRCINPN